MNLLGTGATVSMLLCVRALPCARLLFLEGIIMTEQLKAKFVNTSAMGIDAQAFCSDVALHLCSDNGITYKETIETGCKSAARGGYTAVCTMPNLNPVPDSVEHLKEQLDLIERDAFIHVYPYASITVGQKGEKLSDLEGMSEDCFAFSDDGRGVQSEELMREAMLEAKRLSKAIVAHCEDNSLLFGGYIHDGDYAKVNGSPLKEI